MTIHDALAIDGGTPVRTEPLDFSKGSSLLGSEEADALAAVIAGRSLFRYKGGLETGHRRRVRARRVRVARLPLRGRRRERNRRVAVRARGAWVSGAATR